MKPLASPHRSLEGALGLSIADLVTLSIIVAMMVM